MSFFGLGEELVAVVAAASQGGSGAGPARGLVEGAGEARGFDEGLDEDRGGVVALGPVFFRFLRGSPVKYVLIRRTLGTTTSAFLS